MLIPDATWQSTLDSVRLESQRMHALLQPAESPELDVETGVLRLSYSERYRFHQVNAMHEDVVAAVNRGFTDFAVITAIEARSTQPVTTTDDVLASGYTAPDVSVQTAPRLEDIEADWVRSVSDREIIVALLTAVRMATERAWLATPWWRSDQADARNLVEAAKRAGAQGVDIRVLMRPLRPDSYGLERSVQWELAADSKVDVRLVDFMHLKTFVVDGVALVGSMNLVRTDIERNENDALLVGGLQVDRVAGRFEELWAEANVLDHN